MRCVIHTPELTIYHGDAIDYPGIRKIDLVLTNPYGFLPRSVATCPMVIHQWEHRRTEAERWCYNVLTHRVGAWNNAREAFWSANMPEHTVDICEFTPEPGGWYPEAMVRRLLTTFAKPKQTIWDGFMGRGTVAKVALELGMYYVGVEQLERHIDLAREYLAV